MNTKKHIIHSPIIGHTEDTYPDYATAEKEAKRLADRYPREPFAIYALVATVTASVKVDVRMEDAGQSAAPLSPDVAPVKPDHYPHLRPVPPELLPLPEGAVYLGRGGEFLRPTDGSEFNGLAWCGFHPKWHGISWVGNEVSHHYCAPADSEIVKLNREGGK